MKMWPHGLLTIVALALGLGFGYSINKPSQTAPINTETVSQISSPTTDHNSHTDMEQAMSSMTGALQGKTGDTFDQAFLSEMIVHHQGAVEMAELALTNAKHQEIKDLAEAIIKAQNQEIADMQEWQEEWR
jgi:uncharacterized protein (DUF305 family)